MCWRHILQTLVCYRLIDPGSEWRLHRQWFEQSAMADLLGGDFALVEKNALYRCLDKLLPHEEALFSHLRQRWQDLFGARFKMLVLLMARWPREGQTSSAYRITSKRPCVSVWAAVKLPLVLHLDHLLWMAEIAQSFANGSPQLRKSTFYSSELGLDFG